MTLSNLMKLAQTLIRIRGLARRPGTASAGIAGACPPRAVARCVAASPIVLAACSDAPAQNVLGSFFPSWMVCALLGVAAAVACRLLLAAAGIEPYVPAPPLTYIALAAASALLVWLCWFGH